MDSRQFLQTVLPDEGFYCLARPHEKGYFLHRVVDNLDDIVRIAQEMDEMFFDVYFSVASLKQERMYDPAKNSGKGGYRYRTKSNIHQIGSVFFEADVLRPDELENASDDERARKYESRTEALQGIKAFCSQIDWPLPMLVSSGWGYHFYWPLEEAVTPQKYEVLVKKLKLAAKHFKFKLDVAAADVSRVFRVPGTHNNKDPENRRVVEVLKTASNCSFEHLEDRLDSALGEAQVSTSAITERMPVPDYLNFGDSNLDDFDEALKLRPIVEKCGAIRSTIEDPDNASYYQWYHTLQVVRFCENGESLAHKISALASDYDEGETDKMLRSLREKGIGPTLCDTFSNASSACASCPYRHKIRSPAALGRDAKTFKQTAARSMQAAIGKVPPPPWPYKHEAGKGVIIEKVDKEGNPYEEVIFNYDMTPVKRLYSERDQKEVTIWKTNNPADGFVEIEIPSAAFYDKKSFSTALADEGVYCDLNNIDALRAYMIAYVQELQRLFMKEWMYARVGWRDEGESFVLGESIYHKGSIGPCNVDHGGRVMTNIQEHGTLQDWKRILTFFEGDEFVGHQFALGVGLGSVLLNFTGISGGIVNLIGQSGEGKSTVQKVINSIWGHPTHLMLPAETKSSTYNAKISFINTMNNLPICAEEITNASPDEIGSLAYAITQGTEKWRADIKGNIRESTGGWCTIMLSSSNTSLIDQLDGSGGAVAKALRIFEYRLHRIRRHTKADFQRGVDLALLENYGVAGPLLVEHLVNNLVDVREELLETMVRLDRQFDLLPEERIWSAVFACAITGLNIAKRIGLHDFDIDAVEDFLREQVYSIRVAVQGLRPPAIEVLARFLNGSIRDMLVVEDQNVGGSTNTFVVHKPVADLNVRYEASTGDIYIARQPFKHWCQEHGFIFAEVMDELKTEGMVKADNVKKVLSAGCDWSGGQIRSVRLDGHSPSFRGGLRTVKESLTFGKPNTGGNNVVSR